MSSTITHSYTVAGDGRTGVVTLTRAGHPRRYPVQSVTGKAPRYLRGAEWKLVPVAARDRIEWHRPA